MLAFEVVLNGQRIAIAGAEDLNVLNGMVTAVGKLGSKASGTKAHPKGYDLHLSVGGLTGQAGRNTRRACSLGRDEKAKGWR